MVLSARMAITREGGIFVDGMGQKYVSSPYSVLAMVLGVGYGITKPNREGLCSQSSGEDKEAINY